MPPNVVRAVAALTEKRVTVIVSGKSYETPSPRPELPVVEPDPLEVMSKQWLERDAETSAMVVAVKAAMDTVAAGQAELTRGLKEVVREIVGTLHLPVVPTKYDKDGRIVEARRKEKP